MGDHDPAVLADVADAANLAAELVAPGGEGLCLPVTAAICWALTEHGVEDVHAVAGAYVRMVGDYPDQEYEDHAHWWVRVGGLIVDPTRRQFDNGPLVDREGASQYVVETEYPPGWTREHVAMEARRAFRFSDSADAFTEMLLTGIGLALNPKTPTTAGETR